MVLLGLCGAPGLAYAVEGGPAGRDLKVDLIRYLDAVVAQFRS